MKNSTTLILGLLCGLLILSGCGKSDTATAPHESGDPGSNAPQTQAVVELTSNQLKSIKIEPVGTFFFPIECEAVGSVSFDEDPAVVQSESTLISAMAALDLANKTLARLESLGQTNGIAQKDLEQAISTQVTAEAALKAARDAVRALGETDDDIDQMIAAGKIESAEAGRRWVLANVAESDSPAFRIGQTASVKVPAFPGRVFNGTVSKIYGTVDPSTHRMAVRCGVEDPRHELRPGMLANLIIRVQDPVETIAIPANGIVRESDGAMTAWVTTDRKKFVQKIVKTGLRAGGNVQILGGLQRGDLAVTENAVFLSNLLNAPPAD